jgi:hypothetical protein
MFAHLNDEWINERGGDGFWEEDEQQRGNLQLGQRRWLARRLEEGTGLGRALAFAVAFALTLAVRARASLKAGSPEWAACASYTHAGTFGVRSGLLEGEQDLANYSQSGSQEKAVGDERRSPQGWAHRVF